MEFRVTYYLVSTKFKLMHKAPVTKCVEKAGSMKNSRSTVSMKLISSWPNATSVVFTECVYTHGLRLCTIRMTAKEYGNSHHVVSGSD